MKAVSAQIRYSAPPQAKFEGDQRWVDLDWLYQSKRRFQSVSAEDFRRFIQAECDHGVPRFLVFYERGTGTWWVRTNDFAERRAARRAVQVTYALTCPLEAKRTIAIYSSIFSVALNDRVILFEHARYLSIYPVSIIGQGNLSYDIASKMSCIVADLQTLCSQIQLHGKSQASIVLDQLAISQTLR